MNDEDIYKDVQKVNLITLLRTLKKEGIENFIVIRRNKFENLLKENKELKKEKVVSQTTGRRNGKTIELAMQLRKELLELPEGKLYGIKNCKNKIIALTKNEVIPVAKIKEKIELMQESIVNEDYSDNTNLVNCSVFDTNIVISYLLELLEEK